MTCVVLAARFFVGFVLLRGGVAKLSMDSSHRNASVSRYSLLPDRLTRPAAAALVATELGVASLLLIGVALRPVGMISGALFVLFACAMTINLVRNRVFECGCGASERLISWRLVGQDLLLCSASLLTAALPTRALALWSGWGSPQTHQAAVALLPVPMLTLLVLVLGVVLIRDRQLGLTASPATSKAAS